MLARPVVVAVAVELSDGIRQMRGPHAVLVFIGLRSDHDLAQCSGIRDLQRGERQPLGVQIVECQVTVGLNDDRLRVVR